MSRLNSSSEKVTLRMIGVNRPASVDRLIEEGKAGDEAHHRDEPRGARMRLDEAVDAAQIIDTRRIFDIGALRVLMTFAKPHQRLARPWVIVIDGDLDDPSLE